MSRKAAMAARSAGATGSALEVWQMPGGRYSVWALLPETSDFTVDAGHIGLVMDELRGPFGTFNYDHVQDEWWS